MKKQMRIAFAAALGTLATSPAAQAQVMTDTLRFEYAVKAACGRSALTQPEPPLAQGQYFTSINVHNPRSAVVRFRYKVAVTGPNVAQGPIVGFFPALLERDGALRIDCNRIRQLVPPPFANPADVFVIIQTPVDVDVVAVYTAAAPGTGGVNVTTMDVERVFARRTLIMPGAPGPIDSGVGTLP